MFKQIIKFGIVGVINTIIDFGLLNLLVAIFDWAVLWANTVSFSVAVLNSFFFNKYWISTFRSSSRPTTRNAALDGRWPNCGRIWINKLISMKSLSPMTAV